MGSGSSSGDETDRGDAPLSLEPHRIVLGGWNVNGLGDYKQRDLLDVASQVGLDVLALCETHLKNVEAAVTWAKAVDDACSEYAWSGGTVIASADSAGGRGIGGVGLLGKATGGWIARVSAVCRQGVCGTAERAHSPAAVNARWAIQCGHSTLTPHSAHAQLQQPPPAATPKCRVRAVSCPCSVCAVSCRAVSVM